MPSAWYQKFSYWMAVGDEGGRGSVMKATYQVAFAFNLYHIAKHLTLYIVPGAMTVDVGGGRVFWGE